MWGSKLKKFEHVRYRLIRNIMCLVGLWPYQSKGESRFFLGLVVGSSAVMISAQVRKVIIEGCTLEIILEAIPPFLVDLSVATNLINCIAKANEIHQLMERIESDRRDASGVESEIIERYGDIGRTVIIAYAVWLLGSAVLFLSLPFAPKIIVALGLMNITAEAQFPFPVDYIVDSDENYVYLQIHICISVMLLINVIVAADGMFVMVVYHGCGVLAAISHRLEHLSEGEDLEIELHPDRADDREFWIISDCVRKHNEAIKYVQLIETVFSWAFFVQIGINVVILTFTAVQMVWKMGDIDELIRQALLTMAEGLHFFFECFFSQRLTDHMTLIFEALNQVRWYKTSIRSRRLLNFMIMRSAKPYEFRAGKVIAMSMENFSKLIQTSVSYFTILLSVQ